jgi:hypothetical protein
MRWMKSAWRRLSSIRKGNLYGTVGHCDAMVKSQLAEMKPEIELSLAT